MTFYIINVKNQLWHCSPLWNMTINHEHIRLHNLLKVMITFSRAQIIIRLVYDDCQRMGGVSGTGVWVQCELDLCEANCSDPQNTFFPVKYGSCNPGTKVGNGILKSSISTCYAIGGNVRTEHVSNPLDCITDCHTDLCFVTKGRYC